MADRMTFQQALQQSRDYQQAADDIAQYHLANFQDFSAAEHTALHLKEDELRDISRRLLAEATTIAWDDLQGTLQRIREATDKMRSVRSHLTSVKRALDFSASAIALGGTILTGNPVAVATASLQVVNLVNEFREEDDQESKDEDDAVG